MTVYCPNCGKPNTDEANACASCGTQLSKPGARKAGKFKGTMMMAGVTAPTPPTAGGTPGGAPGEPPQKKDLAFQQTMLGPMTPPGQPGQPENKSAAGGFGAAGGGSTPDQPAPGGGAPSGGAPGGGTPSGSAPGGGFGASPGGSPPGGGFGAPPGGSPPGGSPPPAGGFGAPPGDSPAGGFGGPSGGPGGPSNGNSKTKLWLGIGLGCLLTTILGCVGGWYYCKSKAEEISEEFAEVGNGSLGAELNRISLGFTLGAMKASCSTDPSGAGTSNFFHPQVAAQYRAAACQTTDQTLEAFARSCTSGQHPCSEAAVAAGTADESRATALGLDAQQCYVYTSGGAKVVACQMSDSLKLVHIESLGAVQ